MAAADFEPAPGAGFVEFAGADWGLGEVGFAHDLCFGDAGRGGGGVGTGGFGCGEWANLAGAGAFGGGGWGHHGF